MFACTAGFDHIASFIAGATTTGHRAASSVAVTMSSERPLATRPMTLAVAGARRISWAQSPSDTCGSGAPSDAHRPVSTGPPVTPRNEGGPTKRVADGVIATRTWQPACVRAEARSTILYAAMPPDTSRARRTPRNSEGTGVGSRGMGLSLRLPGLLNDGQDLRDRSFELVVHHDVVVAPGVLHLSGGNLSAGVHVRRRLGVALFLAPHQLVDGRRHDEDEDPVGHA